MSIESSQNTLPYKASTGNSSHRYNPLIKKRIMLMPRMNIKEHKNVRHSQKRL